MSTVAFAPAPFAPATFAPITGLDSSSPRAVEPEPSTVAVADATATVDRASGPRSIDVEQWMADRSRATAQFLLEVRSDLANLHSKLQVGRAAPMDAAAWAASGPANRVDPTVPVDTDAPAKVVHVYESLVTNNPRLRSDRKIERHIRRWRSRGYELAGFVDNRSGAEGVLRATLTFRRVLDQAAVAPAFG